MSELPQIDPKKLYNRVLAQVNNLNDQNIQMDVIIEALKDERDAAIKERDDIRLELANMVALMDNGNLQKANEDNKTLET